MAWHEDISLEVAVEFQKLTPWTHGRIEDALWIQRHYQGRAWSEYSKWFQKTTIGRARHRAETKANRIRRTKIIVAVRACTTCGTLFELNAYNESKGGPNRVCSRQCTGAGRKNIALVTIGGVAKPLAHWAKEAGQPLYRVCKRIKSGWTPERALSQPPRVMTKRAA